MTTNQQRIHMGNLEATRWKSPQISVDRSIKRAIKHNKTKSIKLSNNL